MSKSLLPPGASALEQAAARIGANAQALAVPIRTLWNPRLCPLPLLPYLAWACSVDRWDDAWPETTKRSVIAAAWFVHQHKGTIGAVRRVVEPLGYLIEVLEWWQETPTAMPGTFKLKVGVQDAGITDEMYQELERLIDDAKPLSRRMRGLAISLSSKGVLPLALSSYQGDILTLYPYTPEILSATLNMGSAGAIHTIETLTIRGASPR